MAKDKLIADLKQSRALQTFATIGASASFAGAMLRMRDDDNSGWDDRAGKVAAAVGAGFTQASQATSGPKAIAGIDAVIAGLQSLRDEMEAELQ